MSSIQEHLSQLKDFKQRDYFPEPEIRSGELTDSQENIINFPGGDSEAIQKVVNQAILNSEGELEVNDDIYLAKVNLTLRKLIKHSTGQLVDDELIRKFYSDLLSVTTPETKSIFLRFIYNQIVKLDDNPVINEEFIRLSEETFEIMLSGPSNFKLELVSANQNLKSRLVENAPKGCTDFINLKNMQSLHLWFSENKGDTIKIVKELPDVIELLFHYRPENCWEIYKSLKGGKGNFVDYFTQENIFDNYIDLIESWGLTLEKLHTHYKSALRQILEFHRFNDEHILEKSLNGQETTLEDRESVIKDDLEYAYDKLKQFYPNAIGVLIPESIQFDGSEIKSYSTPSILESDLCTIVTKFQDIIQGKVYWDSHKKAFVDNKNTPFQAPINSEGWDMMILARFLLMIMYEDNRLLGEYKYERLKLLRKSFIQKHSKYLKLERNDDIAVLSGSVYVPSLDRVIPFKMIVPDVKTKPSVLRKIFAKGIDIMSMKDKLRCKFVFPENLSLYEMLETVKCMLAYVFSTHGDTTMEKPRCTLRDETKGVIGNAHNAFSNAAAQAFKFTVRFISDSLKTIIEKKRNDRSALIDKETISLKHSSSRISEIKSEIAKLSHIAGSDHIFEAVLESLEQERLAIRNRIAKLNLIENFDMNLDLHDEDSVCVEIQITRGPGPDDHDRYEYDMVRAILKRNIPFHERAVKESLDFLLFNTFSNIQESSQHKRYMWHVQLLVEYLLDEENEHSNMFDVNQNQLKLNQILNRLLGHENEVMETLFYEDRERQLRSFVA